MSPPFAPPIFQDVLAVSSQVIHGSVGNRATQTVLAHFGHRVWSLPTILLPWHPGHGKGHRTIIPTQDFAAMIEDLIASPRIHTLKGIVTGYLGTEGQAASVAKLVRHLKRINPETIYLCDPVMGDAGQLYVPEAIAQSIATHLLPLADIITPNHFELEWLSGMACDTIEASIRAARSLPPRKTIQTSVPLAVRSLASGPQDPSQPNMTGLLMTTPERALLAKHPAFDHAPNGLGDMFGALILSGALRGLHGEALLAPAAARLFAFAAYCHDHQLDMLPLNQQDLWENDTSSAIALVDVA